MSKRRVTTQGKSSVSVPGVVVIDATEVEPCTAISEQLELWNVSPHCAFWCHSRSTPTYDCFPSENLIHVSSEAHLMTYAK